MIDVVIVNYQPDWEITLMVGAYIVIIVAYIVLIARPWEDKD